MVTPSLVIVGAPHFLSMTTLRPFGPSVTLTAFASASTPRSSDLRAESLNSSVLAIECPSVHGDSAGCRLTAQPGPAGLNGVVRCWQRAASGLTNDSTPRAGPQRGPPGRAVAVQVSADDGED